MKLKRVFGVGCLSLVLLGALAAGVALSTETGKRVWRNRDVLTDGLMEADKAKTAQGVVEDLAAHPERVSLASWALADPDAGVYFDADRVRPLASTAKVLVAATLASAFVSGQREAEARVPLALVERFYFAGTDGAAHPEAMKSLGAPKELTLNELAAVMIHFSDNAAADALMVDLGREALEREVTRLGIDGLYAPAPYTGHLAMLVDEGVARRQVDVDEVWRRSAQIAAADDWSRVVRAKLEKDGLPPIREQQAHRLSSPCRGTARAYATLMARIATDETAWGEAMRSWLSWPMQSAGNRARFEQFGTKGGSMPGVLTGAIYAQPKDGGMAVSALFLDDLPLLVWLQLIKSFAQQDVERRLLVDPAYRTELGLQLRGGDGGS